ncbi:MAG: hypothetical protein LBP79_05510 [Clostridiales bacterium]|nr:hypothetical protein [Clostridiales bacterium]
MFAVKNTDLTEFLALDAPPRAFSRQAFESRSAGETAAHAPRMPRPEKLPKEFPRNLAEFAFAVFWDKDTILCRVLENAGLPVFNGSRAIEICDDKALTALALQGKIRMPKTVIAPMTFHNIGYSDLSFLETAADALGFPLVVKERRGSLGEQVYLAGNFDELKNTVISRSRVPLLFQEFIDTSDSSRFLNAPQNIAANNPPYPLNGARPSEIVAPNSAADNCGEARGVNDSARLSADALNPVITALSLKANPVAARFGVLAGNGVKNEKKPSLNHAANYGAVASLTSSGNGGKNKKAPSLSSATDCGEKKSSADIRIYVINGNIAGAILRRNDSDFRANLAQGSRSFAYEPSREEKSMAETAAALTGLFFGGADIAADGNGVRYLLEMNSNAGFTGLENTVGADIAGGILDEILTALKL